MQTQPHKYYHQLLTGIGLGLFALALLMNHYHPHNEGIAALPRQSLLQRLAIGRSGGVQTSTFSYVGTLSIPQPKTPTPKISDPTTPTESSSPVLPVASKVGDDQADTTTADNPDQTPPTDQQNNNGTPPTNKNQTDSN